MSECITKDENGQPVNRMAFEIFRTVHSNHCLHTLEYTTPTGEKVLLVENGFVNDKLFEAVRLMFEHKESKP